MTFYRGKFILNSRSSWNLIFDLTWKQSSAALTEGIRSFDGVWPLHSSYAVVRSAVTLIIHIRRAIKPQIRQPRIHTGSWTPAVPWKWAPAITISHTMERASYITAGLWSFNSVNATKNSESCFIPPCAFQSPAYIELWHRLSRWAHQVLNHVLSTLILTAQWRRDKPRVPKHFSMAASQNVLK